MDENREFERRIARLEMVIKVSNNQIMQLTTQDISDGGIFVLADASLLVAIGTEVTVMPVKPLENGEQPAIRARVVRHSNEGMGIEFLQSGFS